MIFTLRDYQKKAVEKGLDFFKNGSKSGALEILPTASGKSLVVASIGKELEGKTLVLQPNAEILEQNYNKTLAFGFTDVAIFSASLGKKEKAKITFATIGSVYNRKEEFLDIDNIIIDEAHLVNSKAGQYKKMVELVGGKVLGLTATPFRLKYDRYLDISYSQFLTRTKEKIFKEVIHITEVAELYELGFLSPIKYNISTDLDKSGLKENSTKGNFTDASLSWFFKKNKIGDRIINGIKRIENLRKHILIFVSFVNEAEILTGELKKSGINAEVVSSKTKKADRVKILEDFKSGKIKVIVNVGVLTTGFDFPELDTVIMARPTKSLALYYQMVGRGLRIAPNKKDFLLVDLAGNVEEFGKVENYKFIFTGKNNNLPVMIDGKSGKYLTKN